jgi:hypothetical protein
LVFENPERKVDMFSSGFSSRKKIVCISSANFQLSWLGKRKRKREKKEGKRGRREEKRKGRKEEIEK